MSNYKVVLKFKIGTAPKDNKELLEKLVESGVDRKFIKIEFPSITITGDFSGTVQDFINILTRVTNIGGIDFLELTCKDEPVLGIHR